MQLLQKKLRLATGPWKVQDWKMTDLKH